ncbi:MAG TPA: beta-propeller fold lactonase family protein [Candidatus Angelobacter sp.]|nr:beta-propeller fold lactonase family protein [Candidatus Angelobacter sp.]
MKAFISIASLFMIVLASGCLGSSSSSNPPTLAFVYTVGSGSNSINALGEQSTGQLVSLAIPFFPTNPRPASLAIHPSKNFLYATSLTANTVSGFAIDHTGGVLTPIGTAAIPTPVCASTSVCANPISMGINSAGQFLVILNQGVPAPATVVPASISVFSIDTTRGLLTPVAGSPFASPSLVAGNPQALLMLPSGNVFYVSNGVSGTISAFSIGSDGTLSEIAGSPFTAGTNMTGMATDPKGQFLYASDFASNTIASFSIQASGALAPVAGSPFSTNAGPFALAVDAKGAFLFSTGQVSATVTVFSINSGVLTQVAGSPFPLVASGTPQPAFVTVDVSNTFLYVANPGTRNISVFTIKPDGTLVPLINSPFNESDGPQWIVTTQ